MSVGILSVRLFTNLSFCSSFLAPLIPTLIPTSLPLYPFARIPLPLDPIYLNPLPGQPNSK